MTHQYIKVKPVYSPPPAEGFRSNRGFPGYKACSLKDAACSGMFVEMMEYDDCQFCSSNFTHDFMPENSNSWIFDYAHFLNKNGNISNSFTEADETWSPLARLKGVNYVWKCTHTKLSVLSRALALLGLQRATSYSWHVQMSIHQLVLYQLDSMT